MGYKEAGEDPYLYPGTEILRNLASLRDGWKLEHFETEAAVFREAQLQARPIPGNFDLAHLKAVHGYLFQDAYAWAGELRTVDISKGGSRFASHHFLESYARGVFQRLAGERRRWQLTGVPPDFAGRLADYLGEINAMHPFREGNGRTQRVFIGRLAYVHGFQISWERMSQEAMVEASIASMKGNDQPLAKLLGENLKPVPTAD